MCIAHKGGLHNPTGFLTDREFLDRYLADEPDPEVATRAAARMIESSALARLAWPRAS